MAVLLATGFGGGTTDAAAVDDDDDDDDELEAAGGAATCTRVSNRLVGQLARSTRRVLEPVARPRSVEPDTVGLNSTRAAPLLAATTAPSCCCSVRATAAAPLMLTDNDRVDACAEALDAPTSTCRSKELEVAAASENNEGTYEDRAGLARVSNHV